VLVPGWAAGTTVDVAAEAVVDGTTATLDNIASVIATARAARFKALTEILL
jgi:hypothetical protein